MKTIIRVNKNQFGAVELYFQSIESFIVVRNENIQYLEDRTGYSDWIHSGDLINCEFAGAHTAIKLNCEYKHGLDLDIRDNAFSGYKLAELQKEINAFKRIDKNIDKDLENIGEHYNSVDMKILLNILFNRLHVIGGLLDVDGNKQVFNGCNKSNFIDNVISTL